MVRRNFRIRVDDKGRLEVIDPGYDTLALMQAVDPGFEIRTAPLSEFKSPNFKKLIKFGCGFDAGALGPEAERKLWDVHADIMTSLTVAENMPSRGINEASILDLKIELAKRIMTDCRLCARRCRVDRLAGDKGCCRLDGRAYVAEHFVHINEEPVINPSSLISLAGCGLQCRFCQQHELLNISSVLGEHLGSSLWSKLELDGAKSLSFIGGNPDESLLGIFRFISTAPSDWKLPIVWNSNAYSSLETLLLNNFVVDVYIPDFKFGSRVCADNLANAPNYPDVAKASIISMLSQKVLVIVRILVLPGHFQCCHIPVIDFLSEINTDRLLVSVRGQYFPEWQITEKDGDIMRRPNSSEVDTVRSYVIQKNLKLVD